jgi:uncharacterized protein YcfJ
MVKGGTRMPNEMPGPEVRRTEAYHEQLVPTRPAEDRTFEAVEVAIGLAAGGAIGGAIAGAPGVALGAAIGAIVGATAGELVERLAGPAATTMDATAPRTR